MAQLTVRNLEQSVKTRLQRRAKRHGHSMEEEARNILRNALKKDDAEEELGLGTRIRRRFADIGFDQDIPEFRGQDLRPVIFKK